MKAAYLARLKICLLLAILSGIVFSQIQSVVLAKYLKFISQDRRETGRANPPDSPTKNQGPPAAAQQQREHNDTKTTLRVKTEMVSLSVTVKDLHDRLVPGLVRSNFVVYENNVKQHIEYFSDEDIPISIGILFDVSGSMVGFIKQSKSALKAFVQTCHNLDDFFLISFNHHQNLLAEIGDGESLVRKLDRLTIGGGTALYDSIYLGVEKVKEGRHKKRALLVISDGQDTNSHYKLEELIARVQESDVQIYCIGVGGMDWKDEEWKEKSGKEVLEEISQATGGEACFPFNAKELGETISQISLELRRQYGIGYYPTGLSRDGKWHRIKIHLIPPPGSSHLRVRAKDGYYAAP